MPRSVLHVCDKFGVAGSSIHGVSRLFAWWFPRYDRARYVPYLAGLKQEDESTRALRAEGVSLEMLGRSAFDPRLIFDIGRQIRRTDARILHVHGYAASNFGRIAARRAGIPLVLHEHFADPNMPAYQKIPDFLLRGFTDRAIAVSQSTADFLVQGRFVPKDRVEVVFNGAPLGSVAPRPRADGERIRAELGIPLDAPLITTIGRLNAQKGHQTLIAAAARVASQFPAVRFLVAGDGDLLASLQSQAAALAISQTIVFAGHQPTFPPFWPRPTCSAYLRTTKARRSCSSRPWPRARPSSRLRWTGAAKSSKRDVPDSSFLRKIQKPWRGLYRPSWAIRQCAPPSGCRPGSVEALRPYGMRARHGTDLRRSSGPGRIAGFKMNRAASTHPVEGASLGDPRGRASTTPHPNSAMGLAS